MLSTPSGVQQLQAAFLLAHAAGVESSADKRHLKYAELLGFANQLKRIAIVAHRDECMTRGVTQTDALRASSRFERTNWLDLAARLLDSPSTGQPIRQDITGASLNQDVGHVPTAVRWTNTIIIVVFWSIVLARVAEWTRMSWWSIVALLIVTHWVWPPIARRVLIRRDNGNR